MRLTRYLTASLVLILSACGGEAPAWTGSIDTLASGVVVVRNPPEGLWSPSETWSLTEELRIGSAMSEGPDLFGRITDIAVDREGRIHVLDRQAKELRTFSPVGEHIRTVGREGSGPGEFSDPIGLALSPDGNLWVVDPDNTRYTLLDTAGEYVTAHRRHLGGYSLPWNGGFGTDGRLYEKIFTAGRTAVVRMDTTLTPEDTTLFPDFDAPQFTLTTASARMGVKVPFASDQIERLDLRGYLWTAITGDYAIARMDLNGDTIQVIHGPPTDPVPVSAEDRERAVEELQWFIRQGGTVRPSEIPSEKPPIQNFHVAGNGYAWVEVTPQGDQDGQHYHVFDPEGRFLGTVAAAAGLGNSPLFRGEHVYAVTTDSLGVQYVVRYRIRKDTVERRD